MARDSHQIRNFSLLSINRSSPKPSKSTDDLKDSQNPPLRPTTPSGQARRSSNPRRFSIMGLRAQRSMHDLGATLRDPEPSSHNRLSSLNLNQPYLQSHEASPPVPSNSRRAVSSYIPDHEQPPYLMSAGGPRSSQMLQDVDLMPPPPIGGSFPERNTSPAGSRSSSLVRGRRDSYVGGSPVDSRANSPSRPVTPTSKLNKKKTWSLGKSHGRKDSASTANQPWAFIVGTAEKQPYELSYLTKAQPVIALLGTLTVAC